MTQRDMKDSQAARKALRSLAEKIAAGEAGGLSEAAQLDLLRLAHELEQTQFELELARTELAAKDEQLRQISRELETAGHEYRDVEEFIPVALLALDKKGIVLKANAAARQLLVRGFAPLIGRAFSEFVRPEDLSAYLQQIRLFPYAKKKFSFFELQMADHAGRLFHAYGQVSAKLDPQGIFSHWLLAFFDVSEQKRLEEALRVSREHLALATAAGNIGIWVNDPKTGRSHWNAQLYRMLGLEPRDGPEDQETFFEFIHPADRNGVLQGAQAVTALEGEIDLEFRIIRADDGRVRWLAAKGSVGRDRHGRPVGLQGVNFDITDRKEAEAALRESETKFRMLFNEMISGCALGEIIFDHSGQPYDLRILDLNPALERITGFDKIQILNKRLLEVLPATESYWIEKLGELVSTGEPVLYENYHRQLDKYLATSAFRTTANQIAVTFTDVSDRKRFEIALQKANDELERLVEERTAELAESNVSLMQEIAERRRLTFRFLNAQEDERRRIALELHDELGQDLSLLKLQIDSLKRQMPQREIALKGQVEGISAVLGKTIEKVRRISHELIPSVLVDLGLPAALRWLIKLLKEHSRIAISSDIHFLPDLIPIEQQIVIYRIFQEIFNNIRKHSQATQASIHIRGDDRKVFYSVEDNGIGFETEEVKSRSVAEGGLGLPAMAERVKMLEGSFEIRSRPGGGTRIAFEIPIASSPQQTVLGAEGQGQ